MSSFNNNFHNIKKINNSNNIPNKYKKLTKLFILKMIPL